MPAAMFGQASMFRGSPEHRGEYSGAGVVAFGGLQWGVQTLGPPGSGFIRFFAGDGSAGRPVNFLAVQAVAETRPR